ncbi:succinate dehydrogenase assembly factor 2, partial [Dinochytrium kinnereticum]
MFRSTFTTLLRTQRPQRIARRVFSQTTPACKDYPGEWARKPPSPDEEEVEFTIKVPKPVRPASESIETKRARLVWMSRKRGILETDLLLSTFANKRLKDLDLEALKQYDDLLEENDWDIYYWTTGARKPPAHVQSMAFWNDLVEHCKNHEKI